MPRALDGGAASALMLLATLAAAGCGTAEQERVQIFAAASTQDALAEIQGLFRAETGIALEANLGASSDLARQIEQGAPADLFLSADENWADYLAEKGLVERRIDLLINRLIVVVASQAAPEVKDLAALSRPEMGKLALAGAAVPAGRYARQALTRAGVWEQVKDRVLDAANVRAALAYVARGEAEAGIVYATDAAGEERVRVAFTIPAELHEPIRYPLVLVRRDGIRPEAKRLLDYLLSPPAAEVFRKVGFGVDQAGTVR
jgi:molybdate transport system substrate-binding protein